jgi:hypothetical protein
MIFELNLHEDEKMLEENLQKLNNDSPLEFGFGSKQVTIKDIHLLKPKDGIQA